MNQSQTPLRPLPTAEEVQRAYAETGLVPVSRRTLVRGCPETDGRPGGCALAAVYLVEHRDVLERVADNLKQVHEAADVRGDMATAALETAVLGWAYEQFGLNARTGLCFGFDAMPLRTLADDAEARAAHAAGAAIRAAVHPIPFSQEDDE